MVRVSLRTHRQTSGERLYSPTVVQRPPARHDSMCHRTSGLGRAGQPMLPHWVSIGGEDDAGDSRGDDLVDLPVARDSSELVGAVFLELEVRADHQVLDGSRDKDLVRARK